jgi:hypothetical protein
VTVALRQRRELLGRQHEQPRDEDRLGDASLPVLDGLEGLAGSGREGVQVEAVVPVGPPDERQPVRSQTVQGVPKGPVEVLGQR